MENLTAHSSIDIDAPVDKVWEALIKPEKIKKYMFGTDVVSDWKEGSKIIWKGEWNGKKYEDKGVILDLKPEKLLRYSHFSPLAGHPDKEENYHTVTVELKAQGEGTKVSLSQDKNRTEEEMEHSEKNWQMMLEGLKKLLENPY